MTLANPLGLLFLLAAIPIVALHLLKPRRAEVAVSSAMLWEADTVGTTSASPWQRIPPTLLLFLQLLLVALGALLLADPVVVRESGLAEHTVVVLDTSASMGAVDGDPSRLDAAKDEAIALLDELPQEGRVSLVEAGPTPRVRLSSTTDFEAFEEAVAAIRVSDGPADLQAAMTLSDGLETPDSQLGIVLISDGGHTPTELAALPTGVSHRLVGRSDVNHSISALEVTRSTVGLEVKATLEVTGGGAVAVPIRFDVDDVTQAVLDVEIEPGLPEVVEVVLPEGDRVVARLGGDDLLAIDNTAYATTRSRSDLAVEVVGEPDPFVETLLSVLPGVRVVDSLVEPPDVSIYVGEDVPPTSTRPFLAIRAPNGAPGLSVTGEVDQPAVTLVRSGDPLLSGLDLSRLRISSAQAVEGPTAEVLVGAPGAPLLLRGASGGVPYIYMAFDPASSTLPVELAFPVMGQRILEELSGAVIVPTSLQVGDPIVPPAGRDVTVVAPNGTVRERSAGSGAIVTDRPGFWTITPTNGATRTIAVTLGSGESMLDPLPVAPTDPRPLRPGEEPPSATESWRWLVALLAVVVGVGEYLAIRRRRGVPTWQWRVANALRLAAVALLIGALIGASLPLGSNDVSTVFVLDRSDSVGRLGETVGLDASQLAADVAPGGARLGVVVSGDGARIEQLLVPAESATGLAVASIDGDRSDLAAGLRLASALLPEDSKRRIVLVSDGRATAGDAEAEALVLRERGIPVDYIAIDPVEGADAAVVAVNAPSQVDEGAEIPLEVLVESTVAQAARVTLRQDGEPIATADVNLDVGTNRVAFSVPPSDTGLATFTATVDTANDNRAENDTARTTVDVAGPAEVLVVEGTRGAAAALEQALRSTGLQVEVVRPAEVPALEQLIGFDSTILVDVSVDQLSSGQIDGIVTATRQLGRGLVTIGGPQSYGMGGYRESQLETVLPVISDVLDPQRRRQVAQVMALDTSESMGECHCAEGFQAPMGDSGGVNKTEIARAGAARAISNLAANDEIGVLAVDTQERWLIDLQELPADDVIDSGLAEAVPSGNTDLGETLPTAADALRASNAGLKHIILFTDGFTSDASLRAMRQQAEEIRADGITISVVATGEGAAQQLNAIAEAGGGRFYPGRDLTAIPEILVQESILASREFINEGEYVPVITDTSPIVDGLTESPPLLGFVATTEKDTSRTLLRIGPEEDPLLATWQVGLGRATSWTSDANPRWSQFWVNWDGYVDFWSTLVRDSFPVNSSGAVRTIVDGDTLRIRAEAEAGSQRVIATVSSPSGASSEVRLREIAPGIFEGTANADSAGTYAVAVNTQGGADPEAIGASLASVSYAAEYRPGDSDEAALLRISEASGGRGAIDAAQAWDADGLLSGRKTVSLAKWFLLGAVIAWLLSAIFSRLWLGRRRHALAATEPESTRAHTARSLRNPSGRGRRGARRTESAVAAASRDEQLTEPVGAQPGAQASAETPPVTEHDPEPPQSAATVNELLRARREKRRE